jgi:hypothetical protein
MPVRRPKRCGGPCETVVEAADVDIGTVRGIGSVGLIVFMLAAAGGVFAAFLIVQTAGDSDLLRAAVRAHGRHWKPPRLTVPQLAMVAVKYANPSWITWPHRLRERFVDHAAWSAVVDLIDRGILRTGPEPAIVVLPPMRREANRFYLEPGLADRDARIASAGLLGEHLGNVNVARIVESVDADDRLWNEIIGELVAAGLHHPLKQTRLRLGTGLLLWLAAVVTVYWQIFAGAGADEPAWLRWLVAILTPFVCLFAALATDAVITALERRSNIRLLTLVRKGVGYDYPATAGLVVALDGVDALTRTHPELARRLDIQQRHKHASPPSKSLRDVLMEE